MDSGAAYWPVPPSETDAVPPCALSLILSVPVCFISALALNLTEMAQNVPGARLAGQSLVCVNTPGSEIISITQSSRASYCISYFSSCPSCLRGSIILHCFALYVHRIYWERHTGMVGGSGGFGAAATDDV